MRFMIFAVVAMFSVASTGCFDSSPPTSVTGELVGCITADNDLYCTTKYTDAGVENATPVLVGEINFEPTRAGSFKHFNLKITYTDADGDEVSRAVLVESLRSPWERVLGDKLPNELGGTFTRVAPGDTIAVAIVNLPTIYLPRQGYIIANLTRPDVEFEIPDDVDDVDVLDLTP